MKLFVVRHGETEWNKEEIFRGHIDVPLNENGRLQAKLAAQRLRDQKIQAIYTSPLSRAEETARAIGKVHDITPLREPAFTDLNFGQWQGLSHHQVRASYPELYRQWKNTPHLVTFPRGENLAAVSQRAMSALWEITARHEEDESIAIVTHRVVAKIIILGILGLSNENFWKIRQDTCAINGFELAGPNTYHVLFLNDTCHLREASTVRADF